MKLNEAIDCIISPLHILTKIVDVKNVITTIIFLISVWNLKFSLEINIPTRKILQYNINIMSFYVFSQLTINLPQTEKF